MDILNEKTTNIIADDDNLIYDTGTQASDESRNKEYPINTTLESWIEDHRVETLQLLGLYDFLPPQYHPKMQYDTVIFDNEEYELLDDPDYRYENGRYIYAAMARKCTDTYNDYPTHIIIWYVGSISRPGHKSSIYNNPLNLCIWHKPDEVRYVAG